MPSEATAAVVSDLGQRVNEAVRRAVEIKRRREVIANEDKALGHELVGLVKHAIPDLLAEIGTPVWDTDGVPVELKVVVRGTLNSAPDEAAAVEYLRAHDFSFPLKTVLTVEFTEEERDMCAVLAKSIAAATGKGVEYARTVHWTQLASWASERLADGQPTDLARIGLTSWREANLKI